MEIPDETSIILNEHDKILVRYLPSDPTTNHPDAWEWSPWLGSVPFAFQVFFAAIAILALIYTHRETALLRRGKATLGTVMSSKPKDGAFRVEYEFRTDDGIQVKGKSDSRDRYEAGTHIWIVYLPNNARRNCSYPVPGFDIVG